MNILNYSQLADLVNANANVKATLTIRWETCEKLFQPGTVIHWGSRGYLQVGVVSRVIGSPEFICIRATNNQTGKTVDIHLYTVDWSAMRNLAEEIVLLETEA